MKIKNNFKSGIFAVLPLLVFVWILNWLYETLFDVSTKILDLLPMYWISDDGPFPLYWHLIAIIITICVIWLIGVLVNHYYIGEKIKKISQPIIKEIPILKTLFRVSKQAGDTLTKKGAFKEVVLVEYPIEGVYTIGYITAGIIKPFQDVLEKEVVSVFFPTSPNALNGFVSLVDTKKIIRSKAETQSSIEFIVSMGTVDIQYNKENNLVPGLGARFFL